MIKGKVKWWSTEKGYGFIEYNEKENLFVHLDNTDKKVYSIKENEEIEFTIEEKNNCNYLRNLKYLNR